MSTTVGALVSLIALAIAGFVPCLCLVGRRWTVVPLSVLGGCVVSALAATCYVAVGWSLMVWYVTIAAILAVVSAARLFTAGVPAEAATGGTPMSEGRERTVRLVGMIALLGTGIWCLRGLRNPAVGLDARLFWILRAGWWLMPHAQALTNMQRLGEATHAGYPPLISSTTAVAWWISGTHSERLATVVIALVNVSAAVVAVWALVEFGALLRANGPHALDGWRPKARSVHPFSTDVPLWTGVAVGVLLLFVYFGVTEPFTTNGYADPLWSVATAGAIGYLLLLPSSSWTWGTAGILLAVAGESKTEGTTIAIVVVVLLSLRSILHRSGPFVVTARRVVLIGLSAVLLLGAWPVVMRWRRVAADINTSGPGQGSRIRRAQTVYDAMTPHLAVLVIAAALSLMGACFVARRRDVIESYIWAWVLLVVGLAIIAAAYIFGPGNLFFLDLWLQTSVHRVTDFPVLAGWWIVASTVVLASSVATVRRGQLRRGRVTSA